MGLRSEKKDILRQQIVRLCDIKESVFSFLNSADVWDSEILSLQRQDAFAGNSLSERRVDPDLTHTQSCSCSIVARMISHGFCSIHLVDIHRCWRGL